MDTLRGCSTIAGPPPAILVVDDDAQVLKFVTRMLGSLGYERVFQASSVEEAYEIFALNRVEIFLVISDFVMPNRTGDELILQLQKQKPALKALIISGNDPSTLDSAIPLRAGTNFLQKPFSVLEMRNSVANLAVSA